MNWYAFLMWALPIVACLIGMLGMGGVWYRRGLDRTMGVVFGLLMLAFWVLFFTWGLK